MNAKSASTFPWGLSVILGLLFALSLGGFLYSNYLAGDSAIWQLITSGILLSIPLGLLYLSIGLIIVTVRQKYHDGQIAPRLAKLIYWSPRVAGMVIIFFISLFALDVFEEGHSLGEMLLGFFMHMLPSIALMIVLALAWRWEWIGFVAFLGAASIFMLRLVRDLRDGVGMFLLFSAPLIVIALLFGLNWQWRKELHPTPKMMSGEGASRA